MTQKFIRSARSSTGWNRTCLETMTTSRSTHARREPVTRNVLALRRSRLGVQRSQEIRISQSLLDLRVKCAATPRGIRPRGMSFYKIMLVTSSTRTKLSVSRVWVQAGPDTCTELSDRNLIATLCISISATMLERRIPDWRKKNEKESVQF